MFEETNISEVAASLLQAPPPAQQVAKLTASEGDVGDDFGTSVAIDGEYAIVGADNDRDRGSSSGSAYLFKLTGNNWGECQGNPLGCTETQKIIANDVVAFDYFGGSVATNGEYAIVGAAGDDDQGGSSGAAYIFKRYGNYWGEHLKFRASDGALADDFGTSVAISDDYALVGNATDTGTAYLFKFDGSNWGNCPGGGSVCTETQKLTTNDGSAYDGFGLSLAISGDYAIIGALDDDDQGTDSGAAYLFERNGTNWTQQTKLTASDGATGDRFGRRVAISGDYATVGANGDDDQGTNSGAAYLFHLNGSDWGDCPSSPSECTETQKLTASNGGAYTVFGNDVA
ncbi:MAG: hypothetical protein GY792_30020, partial [Gammaproteobacteria bacterium]|nr:hypothetical protein [Gammaproteobacteria bacterium]